MRSINTLNKVFVHLQILILLFLPSYVYSENNLASFILRNYESNQLPVVGNINAKYTIVEFFDYRCSYCSKQAKDYQTLLTENSDVKIIYVEWPIFGEISNTASNIAILVWNEFPDRYFEVHNEFMKLGSRMKRDNIISMLDSLGLNGMSLYEAGLNEIHKPTIENNFKLAKSLGLRGTPASIVNDNIYPGYINYDTLKNLTSD